MEAINKVFFRDSDHSYFMDEEMTKRIPNYSSIMEVVHGNKFACVPKRFLDPAIHLGNVVHDATQKIDEGNHQTFCEFPDHVLQWERFKRDAKIDSFELIEVPLFSTKGWYACTLDRFYSGNSGTIIDIKTGGKYKEHKIQTACQARCVEENYGIKVKTRMNVYLTETTYKVEYHTSQKDFMDWDSTLKKFKEIVFS